MAKTFRLYIKDELKIEKETFLNEQQTHYLKNVVKYGTNDTLTCFDNKNGEFICEVIKLDKKTGIIKPIEKIKEYTLSPDIWLLFAPLKKENTDFVIEKATELGCRKIIPVITQYTNTTHIKTERYIAQSIEAAEQCRRTDLPEISFSQSLSDVLAVWDKKRTLFFMDETLQSEPFLEQLNKNKTDKAAVLIGPEGGFSAKELETLRKASFAKGATLGSRILRAETAAIAALSCWQLIAGDWSNK